MSFFALSETVTPTITSDMLQPLVDGIVANVNVILPIGISLFALFIGIGIVPTLIKKFTRG